MFICKWTNDDGDWRAWVTSRLTDRWPSNLLELLEPWLYHRPQSGLRSTKCIKEVGNKSFKVINYLHFQRFLSAIVLQIKSAKTLGVL
jgi:hypothetical protein